MAARLGSRAERLSRVRALRGVKGRREQGRFAFEGATLLGEAVAARFPIEELYATQTAYDSVPALRDLEIEPARPSSLSSRTPPPASPTSSRRADSWRSVPFGCSPRRSSSPAERRYSFSPISATPQTPAPSCARRTPLGAPGCFLVGSESIRITPRSSGARWAPSSAFASPSQGRAGRARKLRRNPGSPGSQIGVRPAYP